MELAGCAGRVAISLCQLEVKKPAFQVSLCHGSRWDILLLWGLPRPITKRTWGLNGNRVHGGQSAGNCTSDQQIHITQL